MLKDITCADWILKLKTKTCVNVKEYLPEGWSKNFIKKELEKTNTERNDFQQNITNNRFNRTQMTASCFYDYKVVRRHSCKFCINTAQHSFQFPMVQNYVFKWPKKTEWLVFMAHSVLCTAAAAADTCNLFGTCFQMTSETRQKTFSCDHQKHCFFADRCNATFHYCRNMSSVFLWQVYCTKTAEVRTMQFSLECSPMP